jgi:hypothetical protein
MDKKQNATQSPFVEKAPVQTNTGKGDAQKSASPVTTSQSVMQTFDSDKKNVSGGKTILILLVMVILGVGVGYGASQVSAKTGTSLVPSSLNSNAPAKGKIFGSADTSVFKDTAEGVLKNGGIDGEGQYHLVRPGGDSQSVYLTSSSVDLSQFVNQKIKVWGQTQSAQHAGWLMDVGKVEVE